MASGDGTPKRRVELRSASDSATDVETTDPHIRRSAESAVAVGEHTIAGPTSVAEAEATDPHPRTSRPAAHDRRDARGIALAKRRDDATSWPDDDLSSQERQRRREQELEMARAKQRSRHIADDLGEEPDVFGAPEHTVIAPLPPQEEWMDPAPQPRSGSRAGDDDDRDSERGWRSPQPSRGRDDEWPQQDAPWPRLRTAISDLYLATIAFFEHHLRILQRRGLRFYIDWARPYAQRAWPAIHHWAIKAKLVAVKSAVRVGLVKPSRYEYELESSDKVDRARAEAWRRFHDGRKSSSYLQDDD